MRIDKSGIFYTPDRSRRLCINKECKNYRWEQKTESGWQPCDAPARFVRPEGYREKRVQ